MKACACWSQVTTKAAFNPLYNFSVSPAALPPQTIELPLSAASPLTPSFSFTHAPPKNITVGTICNIVVVVWVGSPGVVAGSAQERWRRRLLRASGHLWRKTLT